MGHFSSLACPARQRPKNRGVSISPCGHWLAPRDRGTKNWGPLSRPMGNYLASRGREDENGWKCRLAPRDGVCLARQRDQEWTLSSSSRESLLASPILKNQKGQLSRFTLRTLVCPTSFHLGFPIWGNFKIRPAREGNNNAQRASAGVFGQNFKENFSSSFPVHAKSFKRELTHNFNLLQCLHYLILRQHYITL